MVDAALPRALSGPPASDGASRSGLTFSESCSVVRGVVRAVDAAGSRTDARCCAIAMATSALTLEEPPLNGNHADMWRRFAMPRE
jgi:hypothetical protein